jgi:dihydrofolate reductase
MKKLVLLMHTSLDGFVAGPNGEMDWIHADKEMFKIAGKRTDESDTALYGRVTYDMMEGYWPTAADQPEATEHDRKHSAWYNSVQKLVVSRSLAGKDIPNTRILNEDVAEEISRQKQQEGKNILLIGSPSVVHLLMPDNLIDEYWLFVNPILLGKGIPLFQNITNTIKLKLESTKLFSSGVICLHYVAGTNS